MSTAAAACPLRPARPACCHSDAEGAGPARDQHRVQAGDVDPELERGGGGQPDQAPVAQRRLQPPPVLGQVAGAVGRDLGVRGAAAASPRPPPRRASSDRRAASATASAPRRDLMKASVGTFSLTSRPSRSAASAVAVRRSRAPASPRASVSGGSHSANVSGPRGEPSSVTSSASSPVSSRAQAPGVADRGRGEHEDRPRPAAGLGRSVMRDDPAQPAQHLRHVRAEHPAVAVALVDHHVAQPAEEPRPAGVPGQQRPVQHVRGGQQVAGVARAQARSARVESPSKTAARTPGRPRARIDRSWSAARALVGAM